MSEPKRPCVLKRRAPAIMHTVVQALMAIGLASACQAQGPGTARPSSGLVATYGWGPDAVLEGPHAPRVEPFRSGHALQFSRSRQTRLDLRHGRDGCLRLRGPFTLAAVVQLPHIPQAKTPFVSRWDTPAQARSYELGVTPDRRLFFAVSATGRYDRGARELYSSLRLKVGVAYLVAAVYEPGRSLRVYANGALAGRLTNRVPKTLHDPATPVWLGNRPGSARACAYDGLLQRVWVYRAALGPKAIAAWAQELGLTEPPESEFRQGPLPPTRAITRGPKRHWFGYYDKLEFDPSGRHVLGMEVDFEHRSPKPDDVIKVGMVDLRDRDRWIELGETRAWCWQQGCMLQWRPSAASEVLWNDRQGSRFVCHILDVRTRRRRTIGHPVYTVSPEGRIAVAPDFSRVNEMRRGYGYAGIPDPHRRELAPEGSGIFRVDLSTGEQRLILSIADVVRIPYRRGYAPGTKHYVNHLLFSPDGSRFIFLHRWSRPRGGTRMLTARPDGTDVRVVDDHGRTSHFCWRDPRHILAWSWHPSHGSAFYLYEDGTGKVEPVGKGIMTQNGHCTYLPGGEWILNDTYPDWQRKQHVYLYHVPTGKSVMLGHFESPRGYGGEWRCDTHPRFSPDGNMVVVDSPHAGEGRQLHLIDVRDIVRQPPK